MAASFPNLLVDAVSKAADAVIKATDMASKAVNAAVKTPVSFWWHLLLFAGLMSLISALVAGATSWMRRLDDRAGNRLLDSHEAKRRQDTIVQATTFTVIALVGLYVAAEAALLCCGKECRMFMALLWALAAWACGQLIGFLFAVPKSGVPKGAGQAAGTQPTEGGGGRKAGASNTSLEEISEWLTKIIVGVGLVEAQKIFEHFKMAVVAFAGGLETGPTAMAKALAAAVLVFFPIIGFLGSYLITRTYLAEVIGESDKAVDGAFDQAGTSVETSEAARGALRASEGDKMRAEQLQIGSLKVKGINFSEPALKLAEKFKDVAFDALKTWQEFAAWGVSRLADGKPEEARRAYDKALALNPDDPGLLYEYVAVLDQAGKEDEKSKALDALKTAVAKLSKESDANLKPEECKLRADIYISLTFRLLYVGTKEAREEAIRFADEFLGFAGGKNRGAVLVNRICARGQLAGTMADKATPEFTDLRNKALQDMMEAMQINRDYRARLRFLMDPNHPDKKKYKDLEQENDLVVFSTDREFAEAVGMQVQDSSSGDSSSSSSSSSGGEGLAASGSSSSSEAGNSSAEAAESSSSESSSENSGK